MAIIVLGFKTLYTKNKPTDYVEIAPSGEAFERTRTWHRISDITPPEDADRENLSHLAMLDRWAIIGPAYEAWKNDMDIPENGTPLSVWSAVTAEQVDFFRRMGIKTVEDVAGMGEAAVEKLPFPNKRRYPELAKAFLSGRDKAAAADELEAMREKMAAMEEMLAEAMAGEAKRGPGRPKKVEAA